MLLSSTSFEFLDRESEREREAGDRMAAGRPDRLDPVIVQHRGRVVAACDLEQELSLLSCSDQQLVDDATVGELKAAEQYDALSGRLANLDGRGCELGRVCESVENCVADAIGHGFDSEKTDLRTCVDHCDQLNKGKNSILIGVIKQVL